MGVMRFLLPLILGLGMHNLESVIHLINDLYLDNAGYLILAREPGHHLYLVVSTRLLIFMFHPTTVCIAVNPMQRFETVNTGFQNRDSHTMPMQRTPTVEFAATATNRGRRERPQAPELDIPRVNTENYSAERRK